MTPSQVQHVLDLLKLQFPRSKLTDDELQTFGEGILRIDIDQNQAEAIVKEHRRTNSYPAPKFEKLLSMMWAAKTTKSTQDGPSNKTDRHKLVDTYRARWDLSTQYSDQEVAEKVARDMASGGRYTRDQAREHLHVMFSELVTDPIEVWRLTFLVFPDAELQRRVREHLQKIRDRCKATNARLDAKMQQAMGVTA